MTDGKLVLNVPLANGGSEFVECSKGISKVEEKYLKIVVPDWMATKMGFGKGSLVDINNRDGKLHIDSAIESD